MSIRQSRESELRYIKRQNLEQEAKVIGNYYRDIIRSYGTDVVYQKLDTSVFDNYKQNIDTNTILQRAYGIQMDPDYTCSADMISYLEIDQDIFQLNKYGLNPNEDVSFYFDSIDFACALATKLGQYEEHPIDVMEFDCEVPECTSEIRESIDPITKEVVQSSYVSADVFPYQLGLGYAENFKCDMLSGKLSVQINGYEYGKEYTEVCDPYEHTDFEVKLPANPYLYKSFKHKYKTDDFLQILIHLTYKVSKVIVGFSKDGTPIYKSILHGRIYGGVLFYNLYKIGKYLDLIHPEVGDLITIDFPDGKNAEKYEITDCYDKSLQTDGISPLMHKYIWKCKARRYVNSYDDVEMNEADQRKQEKLDLEQKIDEAVAKKISLYEDKEDAAYGGYDGVDIQHDKDSREVTKTAEYENFDASTALDIYRFKCGSRLVTDGYDLYFMTSNAEGIKLTLSEHPGIQSEVYFESGLRFLKASNDCLAFTNIEGETFKLVEDEEATQQEIEACLASLFEKAIDTDSKSQPEYQDFYLFKQTRTVIWATEDHLFCKLASNGKLYRIA